MCSKPVNCKSCLFQELLDLPAWFGPAMALQERTPAPPWKWLAADAPGSWRSLAGDKEIRKSNEKHFFCTHISAQVVSV